MHDEHLPDATETPGCPRQQPSNRKQERKREKQPTQCQTSIHNMMQFRIDFFQSLAFQLANDVSRICVLVYPIFFLQALIMKQASLYADHGEGLMQSMTTT